MPILARSQAKIKPVQKFWDQPAAAPAAPLTAQLPGIGPVRSRSHAAVLVVMLAALTMNAQGPGTGVVEGYVLDAEYARVIHYEVELVKVKENWRQKVTSDKDGHYEFRGLSPGTYLLQPVSKKCLVPIHKVRMQVMNGGTVHADLELKWVDNDERCITDREHP